MRHIKTDSAQNTTAVLQAPSGRRLNYICCRNMLICTHGAMPKYECKNSVKMSKMHISLCANVTMAVQIHGTSL
jgi:hypothetical protein